MSKSCPRVVVADDHPLVLDGLRGLLEPHFEVVATATDGRALLDLAAELRPDLVVADVSMPGIDGIEATRRLREIAPATRVLILSVHTEPSYVQAAFDAGACGYLSKCSVTAEIERAVSEVLEGRFYVSPIVARAAVIREPAVSIDEDGPLPGVATPLEGGGGSLTPRERDVVTLVGQGLGNREIARRLGVAVTTVRTHLKNAYGKLGLGDRVTLALHAALRLGRWSPRPRQGRPRRLAS